MNGPTDVPVSAPRTDQDSDSYRFGALAMHARLYLLGCMTRAEFVKYVNAANPADWPPVPDEEPK